MLEIHRPSRNASELLDSASIVADLNALAESHSGAESELRTAVARGEKWGAAGFVARIAARWSDDAEVTTLLALLRQPLMA